MKITPDYIRARDIMASEQLTSGQKEFIVNLKKAVARGNDNPTDDMEARASCSKDKRQRFYDNFIEYGSIKSFQNELTDIIEDM